MASAAKTAITAAGTAQNNRALPDRRPPTASASFSSRDNPFDLANSISSILL
eukprot:CAMPEP_0194321774 /NCGR_PEP_ID=MMETSP0171-20130528/17968_1 /TAXON_ID=218684 /ORGANISM="Corethron pennatum, Strain L29A3" /LENGTH=51 /DNA_ID=CAMNT_0039079787 /DNA_START=219 /DNA_END=374 /DNA_ORIENTATION=-